MITTDITDNEKDINSTLLNDVNEAYNDAITTASSSVVTIPNFYSRIIFSKIKDVLKYI